MAVNVLTMKWGDFYGPEYVNRLYCGVERNLTLPFRFLCFTDHSDGLNPGIECYPIPGLDIPAGMRPDVVRRGAWFKLGVFQSGLADLNGSCLFLDLDILVLRSLDRLFELREKDFCLIRDWQQPHQRLTHLGQTPVGNTSVFRFQAGGTDYILDAFGKTSGQALNRIRNDQRFVSFHAKSITWWPKSWVVSFKRHCLPAFPVNLLRSAPEPALASIVAFHGRPNPHEAMAGHRQGPLHRWTRPTLWIAENWKENRSCSNADR